MKEVQFGCKIGDQVNVMKVRIKTDPGAYSR